MRILFVINSLIQGGAQKFTVQLASELALRGHEIEILTFYPEDQDFFTVPQRVKVTRFINAFSDRNKGISILGKQVPQSLVRKYSRLRDILSMREKIKCFDPDIVVAIERSIALIVGLSAPKNTKVLVSERVHPQNHEIWKVFGKYSYRLLKYVYKKNNIHVHAQGFDIAKFVENEFGKPVMVVPNFIKYEPKRDMPKNKSNIVLALGRFSPQKGYDLLIEAWSMLDEELRFLWKLKIYGDGDSSRYQNLIDALDCKESIELNGPHKDVSKLYQEASVFILASRYEGFPNVLAEAMSNGLPCIATDSPSAIRELTLNGKLAKLVNSNSIDISKGLTELLTSQAKREQYSVLASEVQSHFSSEKFVPVWEEFLEYISGKESAEIQCPVCTDILNIRNIRQMKSTFQIQSQLEADWQITYTIPLNKKRRLIFLYKCKKCGIDFFDGQTGDEAFYRACHKSDLYERKSDWDYGSLCEYLINTERRDLKDLAFLDVGSGKSKLGNLLPDPTSNLHIVEMDDEIAAQQKHEVAFRYKTLELVEAKFDVVILSHFIEHVENLHETLKNIRSLCKNGTIVAITVPNVEHNKFLDSPLDWPPHHKYRFSVESLINLTKSYGFRTLKIMYETDTVNSQFDFCVLFRFFTDCEND